MKIRVAILRGGPSFQYDDSIKSGAYLLKHMPDQYHAHDIFIDKEGTWHRDGAPRKPEKALVGIDVVLNALHGNYGEDGNIQKILHSLKVPHTGSSALSSALGMNKIMSKKILQEQGIKTPYYTIVKNTDDLKEKYDYIYNHFYLPLVVKPSTGGGSVGLTVVKDFRQLIEALQNALSVSNNVLIEEFIRGKHASVNVIDNFRNVPTYITLPVEHEAENYRESFQVPGNFSAIEKQLLQEAAEKIHKALNLRHYSQSDFIVTPRRGIYFLEVNSQPVFQPNSSLPKSLEAVGSSLPEFIHHILKEARENY